MRVRGLDWLIGGIGGVAGRWLQRRGWALTRTGRGFVDAEATVAAARRAGLSVCDYRESLEDDPRKKGRRDRIIGRLAGTIDGASVVCEIGAGTGQFLEKVLAIAKPRRYEVYETDRGWREFLEARYPVICHPADGVSLRQTASASCDLVHAHGVFVYLPLLQTMEYLAESARVCRPGGAIVFDCMLDTEFASMEVVDAWLAGPHRFPVIVPRKLLDEFAERHRLRTVDSFSEIFGGSSSQYLVWHKTE